jgi:stearoyl-CoA desaturase (delta-9 desaturase)
MSAIKPNAAQRLERRVAFATLTLPTLVAIGAIAWATRFGVSPLDLGMTATLYVLTMLGITAGYHRQFTHRSFQSPDAVRMAFGALGAMAAQGPVIFWVSAHRRHHQDGDGPKDPHSPWIHGDTPTGGLRGFWHAHVGWMLEHSPDDWVRTVPDLLKDDVAMRLTTYYPHLVAFGLLAPAGIAFAATGRWQAAVSAFLWAGCMRVFLVHHATWLTNSWCHMRGARPNALRDRSTNAFVCALLSLGEGWHNNHHAAPAAARHGWAWWQVDVTWGVIRSLERLGLATRVIPAPTAQPPSPLEEAA